MACFTFEAVIVVLVFNIPLLTPKAALGGTELASML